MVVCLSSAEDDGPENLERENRGFAELQMTARQFLHPAFLLAVRCPKGAQWVNGPAGEASYDLDAVAESPQAQKVLALVAKLLQEQHIEPRRVYLTGQGTGANGVWDLILRHPGVFAAAVPVGGGGSPKHAQLIKDLPVWAFDCADSPSAAGSRAMAAALEAAGSTVARSTEFAADGQMQLDNLWRHPVVRVGNAHRPVVPDWLFEQAQSASQQHRSP